ncbi:MAG: hypothetical protein L0Z53_00770 [Acidobacteriales bacterium]|nr:hypothetical protein [Terriglobales bacterium]
MWRVKFVRNISLAMLLAFPKLLLSQEADTCRTDSSGAASAECIQSLQQQISELKSLLQEMRAEVGSSRNAVMELRKELREARSLAEHPPERPLTAEPGYPSAEVVSQRPPGETPAPPAEEYELLNAKINEQYQTKVESASKYRMRLSGIVLFNMFNNAGAVDNLDFPHLALSQTSTRSNGTFGASLRQSQIGLELFGPTLLNARTSADVTFDFAGGFSDTLNGVSSGLVRLRTGTVRLDWSRTSLVAGQDVLFFSPLSPSTLASLAVPAFSYAGNIWSWTPQIRVEHKLDIGNQRFTLQGGLLDSFTGEPPYNDYYRTRTAGENSRQPAYAIRTAWAHGSSDNPLTLGVAGYYGRQDWGFDRNVDGWAAMTDWSVPLGERFRLTGEFYGGRAAGGLGAGIGRSVFYLGPIQSPSSPIVGVDTLGGWAQLKFKPSTRLEFNAAFGQDGLRAEQVRAYAGTPSTFDPLYDPALVRNRSGLVNVIYRVRSNVLLSLENRQLQTFRIDEGSRNANHTSMSVGVLF